MSWLTQSPIKWAINHVWHLWVNCFCLCEIQNLVLATKRKNCCLPVPKTLTVSIYSIVLTYSSCCCRTWALPCLHSRWCSRTGSHHHHTDRRTPGTNSARAQERIMRGHRGRLSKIKSVFHVISHYWYSANVHHIFTAFKTVKVHFVYQAQLRNATCMDICWTHLIFNNSPS